MQEGIEIRELLEIIGSQQARIYILEKKLIQLQEELKGDRRPDYSAPAAAGSNGAGLSGSLAGEISRS